MITITFKISFFSNISSKIVPKICLYSNFPKIKINLNFVLGCPASQDVVNAFSHPVCFEDELWWSVIYDLKHLPEKTIQGRLNHMKTDEAWLEKSHFLGSASTVFEQLCGVANLFRTHMHCFNTKHKIYLNPQCKIYKIQND